MTNLPTLKDKLEKAILKRDETDQKIREIEGKIRSLKRILDDLYDDSTIANQQVYEFEKLIAKC